MKLFGNSRKSKHKGRGAAKSAQSSEISRRAAYRNKKKKRRRALLITLLMLFTLAAGVFAFYKVYVKPPDMNETKKPDNVADAPEEDNGQAPSLDGRTANKYTFVVLGTDDGNGNTDTIMVVTFDTDNHKLNVVSIPRDTLVNVSWNVKKVNTLYSVGGTDGVIDGLSDILGYELDFYVIVDLDAFKTLVDAIGGVYYDVPVAMDYDDPAQNLSIHLQPGPQQLNGEQAMGVVRFRKGYANADIGRIGTQQDFLMTVASQVLENKDSLDLVDLIKIFLNDVETDLTYGEVLWLAKEFYKMDSANIQFMTLPANYDDRIHQGSQWVSYVTIYVDEWVEMINQYFNPFDTPVSADDLSILTRNASTKAIYATDGVYAGKQSWGNTGVNATGASAASASQSSSSSSSSSSSAGSGGSNPPASNNSSSSNTGSEADSGAGGETSSGQTSGGEESGGDAPVVDTDTPPVAETIE